MKTVWTVIGAEFINMTVQFKARVSDTVGKTAYCSAYESASFFIACSIIMPEYHVAVLAVSSGYCKGDKSSAVVGDCGAHCIRRLEYVEAGGPAVLKLSESHGSHFFILSSLSSLPLLGRNSGTYSTITREVSRPNHLTGLPARRLMKYLLCIRKLSIGLMSPSRGIIFRIMQNLNDPTSDGP